MRSPVEYLVLALADHIGFPVDQIRYVALLFLSYPLAYILRYLLHPGHTPLVVRHIFSLAFGLLFGFLCFGVQMFILFGIIGMSYAILRWIPSTVVQRYSMVWAMGSVGAAHYYRLVSDYGGWHLDFTGPLMIIVQKITLVAYALHDGRARKDSSLNADQRAQKIDVCPSVLEYCTYMFNFHSILAGPTCTIKDYLTFIDGSNLQPPDNPNTFAKATEHVREPSAAFAVTSKLIYSLIYLVTHVYLDQYFMKVMLIAPQYSILKRTFITSVYGLTVRAKFYFIWLLVESINNFAGLGFNGYDALGYPKWDLITNVYVTKIELGTSLRDRINNWNVTTTMWLRRVCYERATISPTLTTYVLSAWWHGFYPGYYISFVFFALATEAARKLRRFFRPHFHSSIFLKWFYDIITLIAGSLCLDIGIMPFDLMWIPESILFWSYWYYTPVFIVAALAFLFPSGKSSRTPKATKGHSSEKVDGIASDEGSASTTVNTDSNSLGKENIK